MNIDLSNEKQFKELLKRPEGVYGGINEVGEEVMILLDPNSGITAKTYQKNGWIQVSEYNKDGIKTDDYIEGRHNTNY